LARSQRRLKAGKADYDRTPPAPYQPGVPDDAGTYGPFTITTPDGRSRRATPAEQRQLVAQMKQDGQQLYTDSERDSRAAYDSEVALNRAPTTGRPSYQEPLRAMQMPTGSQGGGPSVPATMQAQATAPDPRADLPSQNASEAQFYVPGSHSARLPKPRPCPPLRLLRAFLLLPPLSRASLPSSAPS
jgi:cell division protein FtsN